jgi:predicted ferric reductase
MPEDVALHQPDRDGDEQHHRVIAGTVTDSWLAGETGTHRKITDTGSHRRVDTGSTGTHARITETGSHRKISDTGTHARISDTGTHAKIADGPRPNTRVRAMPDRRWVSPTRAWRSARPALSRAKLTFVMVAFLTCGAGELLYLWWAQTPHVRIQSASNELVMGAQLTGLIGGYLLMIEILLMSRIPWLEHRIGSWLADAHRALGGYLLTMLTAHVVMVVWGYSLSLGAKPVIVLDDIFATYPYVLAATIGYLMLLALGFSTMRRFRRKLGYEGWHLVHSLAYPAAALAFLHQILLGAQFTRNKWATGVWIGLNAATALAALRYRLIEPNRRYRRHKLRVTRVEVESADTVTIYVSGLHVADLGAEAGQYFRWRFVTRGLWWQSHPFSLSAAPQGNTLRVTIKGVGGYTRKVKRRVRPGVRVAADGPYGAFTGLLRRSPKVLLVGGGVGVTPLRAIAETLYGRPGDIVFLQRASSVHHLLMRDELDALHASGRITFLPILGPRGKTRRADPMSARNLLLAVPDLAEREVFICGSPAMARTAISNLRKAGVRRRQLHCELFDF